MALTDTFDTPQSRVEAILQNALGAENEVVPQSRVEDLLQRLDEALENGDVDESVQNWLDEHPEATTVQDGSITDVKLSDSLKLKTIKDYVTPQMFGAKGDGVTDDTAAIQACIDDCYERGIYRIFFPRGTYLVTKPIVIYFSYTDFWFGKGITIEGEHKGDTIIIKQGTNTYKDVDTVIYCDSIDEEHSDGTGCIVKNFTIKNESETAESYCINGLNYCRGQFKNLTIQGNYGIKCARGYNNIFDDIIGYTNETFFEDGGTSTLVGRIGCFGANNAYVLKSDYANYGMLFGDNCTGTFIWIRPYGGAHIDVIGTESPQLDCVLKVGTDESLGFVEGQARTVTVDTISCRNLISSNPKYIIINEGRLRLQSIVIVYASQPVAATLCYFDSVNGCCQIGEVSNTTAAYSFDKSLFTIVANQGERNKLYLNTTEYTGYYGENKLLYLGGLDTADGIGESSMKRKWQSVVMGGYLDATAQYGEYKNADGETQRWKPMPPAGSLVLNDIKRSNVGVAGFVSMRGESGGAWDNLITNKAPIPIMYTCTEEQVPNDAKKNGTLLFNTSTSKLEVYYNNAWRVIGE